MEKKTISLQHKAFIGVLVILLPIFVTFLIGYSRNKKGLEDNVIRHLVEESNMVEGLLYQLFDKERVRVLDFSSDANIRAGLLRTLSGDREAGKRLGEYLRENKLPLNTALESICVMSLDGRVVSSTEEEAVGKNASGEVFFRKGMAGAYVSESPYIGDESHGAAIVASAPIKDNLNGKTIGVISNFKLISRYREIIDAVLSGVYDIERGVTPARVENIPRHGVYIVNRDKRLITGSEMMKGAVSGQTVDTPAVAKCLEEKRESAGFYVNFLGARVAGSSVCLPDLDWVMMIETPEAGILAPVDAIKNGAIATALIVAGLIVGAFSLFYRSVIRRIRALYYAALEIARGEYRAEVPVGSGDELGLLSSAFNTMAGEIRKRTRDIRESEERLRAIVDNSTAAIYMKDLEGRYLIINKAYSEASGKKTEDIIGKTDSEVFPEGIARAFRENDLSVLRSGKPSTFEESAALEDGLHHYISVKVPLMDESGKPFALCGISTDVTERKEHEERIERLNRIYSVSSRVNEAIVRIKDAGELYSQVCRVAVEDGGFLMCWVGRKDEGSDTITPAASWGYGAGYLKEIRISAWEEPEGKGPTGTAARTGRYDVCNDIEKEEKMAPWREAALKRGYRSSASFPLYEGKRLTSILNLYSGEAGFFGVEETRLLEALSSDISFAVTAIGLEKEARRIDEERHLVSDISLSISGEADLIEALRKAIKSVCSLTEWDYGEAWAPGSDSFTLEYVTGWYPEGNGIDEFKERSAKLVFSPGRGLPGRVFASKKTEWIRDVSVNGEVFLRADTAKEAGIRAGVGVPISAGDQVYYVLVFFMKKEREEDRRLIDLVSAVASQLGSVIEKRKAIEERLQMQRRYEDLLSSLTVGTFRISPSEDGRIVEANRALASMLDVPSRTELARHRITDFCTEEERFKKCVEGVLTKGSIKGETVVFKTLKDRRIWCSVSAALRKDPSGAIYVEGIIEDITEKKRLEAQLLHSQKMEAVGRLAGGVAHDFNNILTAVIGYANLLLMKEEDETNRSYAEQILTLSERASALTQGLLSFGRKRETRLEAADLNAVVERVEKILHRVIGEDVSLRTALHKGELNVMADTAQVEQVMMNLATNARDAMPGGGAIVIETGVMEMGEEYISEHGYGEKGAYAFLSFSDSGSGMDEEARQRLFEPFFTTKEVGKGTGLGLPIVYGIVKEHRGFIDVYTEKGRGTTVRIYLPLASAAPAAAGVARTAAPRGGTETILLAEDEAEVRKITRTVLEQYGYRVMEAADGRQAVERFREGKDSIDLLILDVVMPGKGGMEAYEEIRKMRPGIKTLFTSGYPREMMAGKIMAEKGVDFVSKPVTPVEMLKKVREALDS